MGLATLQKSMVGVFAEVKRDFEKLESENNRLEEKVRTLSRESSKVSGWNDLTQQLEDLQSSHHRLWEENRTLCQALGQVRRGDGEQGGVRREVEGMRAEVDRERARNKEIEKYWREQVKNREEEGDRIRKKVRFHEEKVAECTKRISELEDTKNRLEVRCAQLEERNSFAKNSREARAD